MEEFHYEQERNFLGSCVITPTKLSRLVNIVGSRLAKMNGPVLLQVTTTTKSGKKSVFDTLETALCQDNSIKNPIRSIQISGSIGGVALVMASYGKAPFPSGEEGCHLYVSGRDASWVNETYAELEEQVERVIVKDVYSLLGVLLGNQILALLSILIVTLSITGIVISFSINSRGPVQYLQKEQILKLNEVFNEADTAEKKSEALFQERRACLSLSKDSVLKANPVMRFVMSKKGFFLIFPMIAAIGCLIYVATKCSPSMVFPWGDWEDHFAKIVKRRSSIMISGVLSFAVGIAASLFSASLG